MRRTFLEELELLKDDNMKLFNFCNAMIAECNETRNYKERTYWIEKADWAMEQNRRIVIEINKLKEEGRL